MLVSNVCRQGRALGHVLVAFLECLGTGAQRCALATSTCFTKDNIQTRHPVRCSIRRKQRVEQAEIDIKEKHNKLLKHKLLNTRDTHIYGSIMLE